MVIIFSCQSLSQNDKSYNVKLQIINKDDAGDVLAEFLVKIADDDKKRVLGLMFVENLKENHAMLFEFKEEKIVKMWMKNTKISLDMLFIDKNNKIVNIYQNAIPNSTKIISSIYKVNKVLEVNAGVIKKLDINIGDYILLKKSWK